MQSIERVGPSKTKALLVCVSLGFSSGLPLFILYNLLSAWLKSEGVDLKAIGLFALVGMPYTWKFLWAPAMDRFNLPFLGRRRGWMIATQIAVMIAVILMGQFNPRTEIWTVVFLASVVSFLSASQDVVIDAHRREWLTEEQMGSGTALFVNAYKLSTLVKTFPIDPKSDLYTKVLESGYEQMMNYKIPEQNISFLGLNHKTLRFLAHVSNIIHHRKY